MALTNNDSIVTRGFMKGFFKRISSIFATKTEVGTKKNTYSFTISNASKTTDDYTTTTSGSITIGGATLTKVAIQLHHNDGYFTIRLDGDFYVTAVTTSVTGGFVNGSRLTILTGDKYSESFSRWNPTGIYKVSDSYSTDTRTDTNFNIVKNKTIEEYTYYWGWYGRNYVPVLTTDTVATHGSTDYYNILPPTSHAVKTELGSYLPLSGGTLTGELQQSTGFIYTNGYINAKSYILTSGYFRGERIQLQPAAGSAPAYIDFFLPGSSVMSGRFINRVDKSIVLELSEYHSSNLLTFDSTTTEYTITKTDGYAGVVGAGTLTIPSISDDDAYTNKSLFGRRIFVDGNQGVITVNYASSCTDTDGNFLDQTIIVGRGQVAEFVLGHSNRWDLMNTDIPVIKKLSGTSYTLSLSDGVSIISGYGSVTLPIAAGWEGRKVVVCNKNPNATGRNTFLSVTRQFVIAGTTYTPSATQFALTTSGEYTFTDGGWIKTGGVGMCAKRVTATGYTLTNTDDVTLITSTEANTITLPNTVGYRGRQLTITSYKGDVIVIFGYTSNTNKKITIPAYTSVIFVKSGDDRWSPQAGLTIESES